MGLDSVELLVRFEKYFEVAVPDAVAERLFTPGDVAVSASTDLASLLPNGEAWAHYAQQLVAQAGWQLPEIGWLRLPRARGWLNQLFNWSTSIATPGPNRYYFADLVDWTLARNFQQLLPLGSANIQ